MRAPLHDIHPSNLLTYGSLAASIGAMAAAGMPGGSARAGILLASAALADTFDGRFARSFERTERQRAIGRELDSLIDIVAFGVTPVVVMGTVSAAGDLRRMPLWWIAAFFYVLAAALRLSFYNVEENDAGFVGLPAPVAGLVWPTCLLASPAPGMVALLLGLAGAAMVLPLAIRRPRRLGLAVFGLWPVTLIAVHAARMLG